MANYWLSLLEYREHYPSNDRTLVYNDWILDVGRIVLGDQIIMLLSLGEEMPMGMLQRLFEYDGHVIYVIQILLGLHIICTLKFICSKVYI